MLAKITQLKLSQKGLKRKQKSFHKNYKSKLPSTADECVGSGFIHDPNHDFYLYITFDLLQLKFVVECRILTTIYIQIKPKKI